VLGFGVWNCYIDIETLYGIKGVGLANIVANGPDGWLDGLDGCLSARTDGWTDWMDI